MSMGASEHRAFVRAKARFAGQKAQEHGFVRRNAVFTGHIAMYRWRHFLAESATRALPFPKSQRPTRPFSSTLGGTPPARPSAASAAARCEPILAFLLLPRPSTCPAWPSAASASAGCEPIPVFPLLLGPSTCPARPSATSASARCEPVPAFPLLPGPPTCPARPSATSASAGCEPIPAFPLLPGRTIAGIRACGTSAGVRNTAVRPEAFPLTAPVL